MRHCEIDILFQLLLQVLLFVLYYYVTNLYKMAAEDKCAAVCRDVDTD